MSYEFRIKRKSWGLVNGIFYQKVWCKIREKSQESRQRLDKAKVWNLVTRAMPWYTENLRLSLKWYWIFNRKKKKKLQINKNRPLFHADQSFNKNK